MTEFDGKFDVLINANQVFVTLRRRAEHFSNVLNKIHKF